MSTTTSFPTFLKRVRRKSFVWQFRPLAFWPDRRHCAAQSGSRSTAATESELWSTCFFPWPPGLVSDLSSLFRFQRLFCTFMDHCLISSATPRLQWGTSSSACSCSTSMPWSSRGSSSSFASTIRPDSTTTSGLDLFTSGFSARHSYHNGLGIFWSRISRWRFTFAPGKTRIRSSKPRPKVYGVVELFSILLNLVLYLKISCYKKRPIHPQTQGRVVKGLVLRDVEKQSMTIIAIKINHAKPEDLSKYPNNLFALYRS